MGIYRSKSIQPEFFYELWKHKGQPYRLGTDSAPSWLQRFEYVYASGDSLARVEIWDDLKFENVVGGIDVIRDDPNDYHRGVKLNKDHYVVTSGNLFMALGPLKGDDHWLTELPKGLRFANYLKIKPSDSR